ncbi:MAG TPA: PAS domain-containing protein [Terriglobales bacterium]|nr:PAS domain-containing protein [Terriglobales bacterium]
MFNYLGFVPILEQIKEFGFATPVFFYRGVRATKSTRQMMEMRTILTEFNAERLFADFFNSSDVGLAILDDQLRYQALNLPLAEMNGIAVEFHLGKTLRDEQSFGADQLLAEFLNDSHVGFAIIDDQLRYRALNLPLAEMNGIAVEFHLGKTLREVLGEVALQVEPAIKQVLATGRPIFNFVLAGTLPARAEATRFVDHFLPIKDAKGRVKRVGAVVVELRPDAKLELAGAIQEADSLSDSAHEVLRTWKEIANYVRASVKTVQRWEQRYNFPIRRLERSKGAVVFALKAEVDSWIRMRSQMFITSR